MARARGEQRSPIFGLTSSDAGWVLVGLGAFVVVMVIIPLLRVDVKKPSSDNDPAPKEPSRWSCTPPAFGRTVNMPGVRVASGNTTLVRTFTPQVLLCEPGTVVHLGNASTIENGARVLMRALDPDPSKCAEYGFSGVCVKHDRGAVVIASCVQSGCEIFRGHRGCGVESTVVFTAEFMFVAEWNAWYEL